MARRRGPKPLPTHLKLLRGNPGHQVLNKNEPQPALDDKPPEAPAFLTGYAADEWYRVCEELYRLKLLTSVDINPLAAYCQSYCIWRTAVETLKTISERDPQTKGLLIKSATGTILQNPLVLTARQAANDMVRHASEFGLTPVARTRLNQENADRSPRKFGSLIAG